MFQLIMINPTYKPLDIIAQMPNINAGQEDYKVMISDEHFTINNNLNLSLKFGAIINENFTVHTKGNTDIVYELYCSDSSDLFNSLSKISGITSFNILTQDGECQF